MLFCASVLVTVYHLESWSKSKFIDEENDDNKFLQSCVERPRDASVSEETYLSVSAWDADILDTLDGTGEMIDDELKVITAILSMLQLHIGCPRGEDWSGLSKDIISQGTVNNVLVHVAILKQTSSYNSIFYSINTCRLVVISS